MRKKIFKKLPGDGKPLNEEQKVKDGIQPITDMVTAKALKDQDRVQPLKDVASGLGAENNRSVIYKEIKKSYKDNSVQPDNKQDPHKQGNGEYNLLESMDPHYEEELERTLEGSGQDFLNSLMGRLISDVKYFLGASKRNPRHLWADGNVLKHIQAMETVFNKLDPKPEGINKELIKDLGDKMRNPNYGKTLEESYHPDLLRDLINNYRHKYNKDNHTEIWLEIKNEYYNEDLANDVLDSLEGNKKVTENYLVKDSQGFYNISASLRNKGKLRKSIKESHLQKEMTLNQKIESWLENQSNLPNEVEQVIDNLISSDLLTWGDMKGKGKEIKEIVNNYLGEK